MGEVSMYAQQLAAVLQQNPNFLAISHFLQSVADPREALRQNVHHFCDLLSIPIGGHTEQGYRILDVLFQHVLSHVQQHQPQSVYDTSQVNHKAMEYTTQRQPTGYNDCHHHGHPTVEDSYGLDSPTIDNASATMLHQQALQQHELPSGQSLEDGALVPTSTNGALVSTSPSILQHHSHSNAGESSRTSPSRIISGAITQPIISTALVCEATIPATSSNNNGTVQQRCSQTLYGSQKVQNSNESSRDYDEEETLTRHYERRKSSVDTSIRMETPLPIEYKTEKTLNEMGLTSSTLNNDKGDDHCRQVLSAVQSATSHSEGRRVTESQNVEPENKIEKDDISEFNDLTDKLNSEPSMLDPSTDRDSSKISSIELRFDELMERFSFNEKLEFLQGLASCDAELSSAVDVLHNITMEDAEDTLLSFKSKVLNFLNQCPASVFLPLGASVIQSFPYFHQRISLHATCYQCSSNCNQSLSLANDVSQQMEDLRRLLFIKLAEALRAARLTERCNMVKVISPSNTTPSATVALSASVSSNESSDIETEKPVLRRSKRNVSSLLHLTKESTLDRTPKRQKTSSRDADPIWEPPGSSSTKSTSCSGEEPSPEAKAVTNISYLVPLLSGLCSNDPSLAVQVSDILSTQLPNSLPVRRLRARWRGDCNSLLGGVKSDFKSVLDSSISERKGALIRPVNERDAELLRMPNHIITKSGIILPPSDSVLYLSKVVGVVWDKIHKSWVVNYTLLGRRYFHHFPAKKFGFLEGRKLAIELRLAKDREKALVEGAVRGGGRRAQGPSWDASGSNKKRRRRRKTDDDSEEMNEQNDGTDLRECDDVPTMAVDVSPSTSAVDHSNLQESTSDIFEERDNTTIKPSIVLKTQPSELSTVSQPQNLSASLSNPLSHSPVSTILSGHSFGSYVQEATTEGDENPTATDPQEDLPTGSGTSDPNSDGTGPMATPPMEVLHPQTAVEPQRIPVIMALPTASTPAQVLRSPIDPATTSIISTIPTNQSKNATLCMLQPLNPQPTHLAVTSAPQFQHLLSQHGAMQPHPNSTLSTHGNSMSPNSLQPSTQRVLHHHAQLIHQQYGMHHLAQLRSNSNHTQPHYP